MKQRRDTTKKGTYLLFESFLSILMQKKSCTICILSTFSILKKKQILVVQIKDTKQKRVNKKDTRKLCFFVYPSFFFDNNLLCCFPSLFFKQKTTVCCFPSLFFKQKTTVCCFPSLFFKQKTTEGKTLFSLLVKKNKVLVSFLFFNNPFVSLLVWYLLFVVKKQKKHVRIP